MNVFVDLFNQWRNRASHVLFFVEQEILFGLLLVLLSF